jgi:cysteine desulfurase
VFTSGATEALNLAVQGLHAEKIIVSSVEHPGILELCRFMQRTHGTRLRMLPVDPGGRIELAALSRELREASALVICQWANSETGVIQDVTEIAKLTRAHDSYFLCDASQSAAWIPIEMSAGSHPDILVFASHKIYGPAGVGALVYDSRTMPGSLRPMMIGGGHEYGLRPGSQPAALISAFCHAYENCVAEQAATVRRVSAMRDQFESEIARCGPEVVINSSDVPRVPNTSMISLARLRAEDLITAIPDIAVSTGSACTTGQVRASHVLTAMGVPGRLAENSLRISFGKFNKDNDGRIAGETFARFIGDATAHT